MTLVPVERSASFGFAHEATIGTRVPPTFGLENIDKGTVNPGQTWADDRKAHGLPYPRQVDKKPDHLMPTIDTTLSMNIPNIGMLLALCTQSVVQSGAGPFTQIVIFPTLGVHVTLDSVGSANGRTGTVVTRYGQTGSLNEALLGAVATEVSMNFGEGRVKPKVKWMALDYRDDDAGTGVFTLPATDVLGRDAIFKLGDGTPVPLYSDEVTITIRAVVTPHWYGGIVSGGRPYRLVFSDWTGEVTFTKPLITGTNSFMKDHYVDGGDVANDLLMYVYDRTMTDYNAVLANGNWRFTLNISPDNVERQLADETKDSVTASFKYDGSNQPFKYEQCTTATQASWAS